MNQGVRAMLRAAVADPANQRFVLLSESCAPLHHPAVVHQQLTHESLSRVDACGKGNVMWERWTWRLEAAGVPATAWRKGAQWTSLTRDHAQLIVEDTAIASAFARHCTYGEDADTGGWRACVPDESYVPTLLAVHGRDNETDCRGGLTAVDWARKEGTGAHPHRFAAAEVDASLIRRLRRQDEPFVLCDADSALDLALRSYRGVDDIPATAADWARVGPYPAIRGVGHQCPLLARKFGEDTTAALEAALSAPGVGVLGAPAPAGDPTVPRSDERELEWSRQDPTWGKSRRTAP